jgi:Flp pilus assembly pilin Flp
MQALSSYVRRFLKEDDGSETVQAAILAAVGAGTAIQVATSLKDGVESLASKTVSLFSGL